MIKNSHKLFTSVIKGKGYKLRKVLAIIIIIQTIVIVGLFSAILLRIISWY